MPTRPYLGHAILRAALHLPNVIAGLASFPRDPFYDEKERTKFFEYMAVGLPILASDAATWTHLIEHEARCGVTVDPTDDATIARTLTTWIDHPETARELGEARHDVVRERYTWHAAQRPLLGLYARLEDAPTRAD